jgi:hypothetical protein
MYARIDEVDSEDEDLYCCLNNKFKFVFVFVYYRF